MASSKAHLFSSEELREPSTPEEMFHEVDDCNGPTTLGEQTYAYLYLLNQIVHRRNELQMRGAKPWWQPRFAVVSHAYNWLWTLAAVPEYLEHGAPITVDCPRCGAKSGQWCRSMTYRVYRHARPTQINLQPHTERKNLVR